jgi:hypothetical protein
VAFAVKVSANDGNNVLFRRLVDMERTRRTAALTERENGILVTNPARLCLVVPALSNEGLIKSY